MSKEFHVFTHQDTQYEQAFVFEVERDQHDETVEFKDLYLVTTTEHGELRTRIQFENMIQSIIHTEGGNIEDSSVSIIIDMFKDLIPPEKKVEIESEINDRQIYNIDPEILINSMDEIKFVEDYERVKNETDRGFT
jgi:hypothetical protein